MKGEDDGGEEAKAGDGTASEICVAAGATNSGDVENDDVQANDSFSPLCDYVSMDWMLEKREREKKKILPAASGSKDLRQFTSIVPSGYSLRGLSRKDTHSIAPSRPSLLVSPVLVLPGSQIFP